MASTIRRALAALPSEVGSTITEPIGLSYALVISAVAVTASSVACLPGGRLIVAVQPLRTRCTLVSAESRSARSGAATRSAQICSIEGAGPGRIAPRIR